MKKITRLLAITAGAVLAFASCKTKEEPIVPSISVSPSSVTFVAASPAAANVTVTSNVEWKADAADTWVTVSPKAGSGNGSIAITAATNVAPEGSAAPARTSKVTLTIEGKKIDIQVNQDAENLVFAVEGTPTEVPAAGASVSVKVEANTSYTFASSADWCALETKADTKAVKTDNMKFIVAENTEYEARTATITFTPASGSAKTVTVNQAAAEKPKEHNIDSADAFAEFAAALKTGDVSAFDLDGDKVVKLTADLEVGALAEPLDTLPAGITLDGENHQIKYVIETTSADMKDLGLFCAVEGTVKNLKVAGSIKESAPAGSGTFHIGGVTGYLGAAGVIENCQSSVDIFGDTKVTHHMGGIVGFTAAGAVVKNCINEGAVKMAIPELGASNASQVGGIIGHIEGITDVLDCENKGTVTYEGLGTPRLAGIVGYINYLENVTIKNTKNSGDVVWVEGAYAATSWSYVGGLTGYFGNPKDGSVFNIENCENTGNITCTVTEANSRVRVGGIMSLAGSSTKDLSMTYNIKNCSNSGTITVTSATADRTVAGGVIGFSETTAILNIDGCTFSGIIDSKAGAKAGGIIGALGNAASTIKNITIDEKAVLKSEGGFKKGNVGIIGGQNTAYTTAVSGKVAGTIIDGDKTWKVNKNNYQNHLFGVALGEGGSTEAVTCDVDGEPDPGTEPDKPAALPFTETFTNNTWAKDDADSGEALSDTQLTQFKNISSVYWARTGLGGIKLGTSSKVGTLDTKDLDLSKDFYVKISAAAYNATEGKLLIKVGTESREIDLTAAGDKVPTEYIENFKATDAKNVTFATATKRAYIQSISINYGQASAPAVTNIGSVAELAALLADASALANATATYKLTTDIDLGGATVPAAAGPLAATIDGQNHMLKNAKVTAPIFAKNEGVIKNVVIDSSVEFAPATVAGDMAILVGENTGTVYGCVNKAAISITSDPAASFIAGLVARSSGLVEKCKNEAAISVNAAAATGAVFAAGVVAQASGKAGEVIVKDSENTGKIALSYSGTPKNGFVAGVVGGTVAHKESAMVSQGVVSGCSNSGEVTYHIGKPASGTYANIGGVAGYIEGDVAKCTNTGRVAIDNEEVADASANCTRPAVAGVVACVEGSIDDCTNSGAVALNGSFAAGTADAAAAGGCSNPSIGGVVGCIGKAARDDVNHMNNCSNTGKISSVERQKVAGKTQVRVGGVAGFISVPVKNCHNEGELDVKTLSCKNFIGGVVGVAFNDIKDSWNDAPVKVDGRSDVSKSFATTDYIGYQYYIGGIYGYAYVKSLVFENLENRSKGAVTVTNCSAVVAYSYAGGIGGGYEAGPNSLKNVKNDAAVLVDSENAYIVGGICGGFNGDVENATNNGVVTIKKAKGDAGKEPELGGLIGYLNGNISGSKSVGALTIETSATSFVGGLVGGFGNADKVFSNTEISCSVTSGSSTLGSVIGRFRNGPSSGADPNVVSLGAENAPLTIAAALKSAPYCGELKGHKVEAVNVK